MAEPLVCILDAAEMLGTDRHTIRGLMKAHGLVGKRMRRNGPAKGLNASDIAILRKALTPGRRRRRRDMTPAIQS